MVIDSSAVISIADDEADSEAFLMALEGEGVRLLSAATLLEAVIVWMRRLGPAAAQRAEQDIYALLQELEIEVEPVTLQQVRLAAQAYRTYGKGFHPAGLNFGDCFAYALAKDLGEPLLFKGGDFAATDIASVL